MGPGMHCTHPSLGLDVFQLALCTLSDALATPQLQPHSRICETHGADRQEVRQYHEHNVVAVTEGSFVTRCHLCSCGILWDAFCYRFFRTCDL